MKRKVKSVIRPHGQRFEAVRLVKQTYDAEDPYLIYDMDDGEASGLPFVIKSSRRKVQITYNLDVRGSHSLNETVVNLDVIHS